MAIGITHHITDDSDADTTSYTTAAFTPSANLLLVACYVALRTTTQPTDPTVTGGSMTWTQVDEHYFSSTAATDGQMWVYAADTGEGGASLTNMTVSFDHGATTHHAGLWSVFSVSGTDLTSSGGSSTVAQCFVQFAHSVAEQVGSPLTATLAAAGATDNRPFFSGVIYSGSQDLTPRAAWTQIGESGGLPTTYGELMTQWRSDAFETSCSMTWASGTVRKGGIGFEVKALVAAAGGAALDPFGTMGFFGA